MSFQNGSLQCPSSSTPESTVFANTRYSEARTGFDRNDVDNIRHTKAAHRRLAVCPLKLELDRAVGGFISTTLCAGWARVRVAKVTPTRYSIGTMICVNSSSTGVEAGSLTYTS